ncbi:MAG: hypothetical protein PF445_07615 [Melioribacteraceae bacterium]|jgi:L-rhamnose mutarotase|nr:hypothetical protein [Melioribacteraceae bacterium]
MIKIKLIVLLFISIILSSCSYTKLASKTKTTIWNNGRVEIIYKHGNSELNTIYNYVANNQARGTYYLSNYDKERISNAVNNIIWSSIPDTMNLVNFSNYSIYPKIEESLEITFGDISKQIEWTSNNIHESESLQMLKSLTAILKDILFNNPAYPLPPKTGRYKL